MKTTTKNNAEQRLARDIQRLDDNIAAHAHQGKRNWANDAEMTKQYRADERRLRAIHDAIRARKFSRAAWLIYRLDTVVRDRIPARLLNTVNNAI